MRYRQQSSASYISLHCPYIEKSTGHENKGNHQLDITLVNPATIFIEVALSLRLEQRKEIERKQRKEILWIRDPSYSCKTKLVFEPTLLGREMYIN